MNNKALIIAVAVFSPALLLMLVLLVVVAVVMDEEESTTTVATCPAGSTSGQLSSVTLKKGDLPSVGGLSSEQTTNAAAILAAGENMGVSARAQTVAVMTALGESSLRVLDHGDGPGPDSRGLFQQRANGAWGTYEERMDPTASAQSFYRALLTVEGWESLPPTLAAHRTQHNADPNHYTRFWPKAVSIVAVLTGDGSKNLMDVIAAGGLLSCDTSIVNVAAGTATWPVPTSFITADRHNFAKSGPNWSKQHTGTDFSAPCGTAVYAATAGTVIIDRTQSWAGPWLVKISTGPGKLTTWYAHMQNVSVSAGDTVKAGQVLGKVGAEGNTTGCHLHFEVHPRGGRIYEDPIDPSAWLATNVGQPVAGQQKG